MSEIAQKSKADHHRQAWRRRVGSYPLRQASLTTLALTSLDTVELIMEFEKGI